ncbi:MAG: hypothetical protein ACYDA3_09310 [Gaiellaceae bacterium]
MVRSIVTRVALLLLLVFLVSACGRSSTPPGHKTYFGIWAQNLPKQRTYQVNWTETTPQALTVRVTRLEIGPHGWTATLGFKNISSRPIDLPQGGKREPKDFGLGVFVDQFSPRIEDPGNYLVYATTIAPQLPRTLQPGQSWQGTFSSPQPPRASRYVRLVLGVFFWRQPVPASFAPYFLVVTQHGVQAPPPQGVAAATAMTTG